MNLSSAYARKVATQMKALMQDAALLPHGAIWYGLIPKKGKNNRSAVLHRWTAHTLQCVMPDDLVAAMLNAAILPTGQPSPSAKALYNWLLTHLYAHSEQQLYTAWLSVPHTGSTDARIP